MTPHRAKIVITNPCSEDWNSMSPATDGRFCASCQKSVIDFSSKSDEEIKAFLKDKPGERLCGRFYTHQVERICIEIDGKLLVSGIPFWQKFLVIILVCFGQDFFGVDFVFAQTQTDSVPVITEQVDSLLYPIPDTTDSAVQPVTLTVDSLQPYEPPIIEAEVITEFTAGMTLGLFTIQHQIHFKKPYRVDWPLPVILEYTDSDSMLSKTGIAHAPQPVPHPKKPVRKPAEPEHALLAETEKRRKTRRS